MASQHEDEDQLAQQLRDACDDLGKEIDPAESAKIIHKLGLVYRQRSPDKFSLIKSAGLLNAAIVRNPSNVSQIKEDLADICKHILQQAKAADQATDLVEKAEQVKGSFSELRDEVDQLLSDTKCSDEENSTVNVQDQNMLKLEQGKISDIQFIQTKIAGTYTKIMANLCEYCENVMGKPPCEYTVMGLGSLARKEITPYSDFDHMLTLEKENCQLHLEYFQWVRVIFHVVILNLQETIIPTLNIDRLNDASCEHGDWFYDSHSRGISFNGMMPHISNYPLGRQPAENKSISTELVKPFDEMLSYFSTEQDLKNGYHLSDLLSKTCFVYGSRKLFQRFVDGIKDHLNAKTSEEVCDDITSQVKDDLNNFSTRLHLAALRKSDSINIKQLVYRSSTLFIAAMQRLHNISANSCVGIINEMAKLNKITQQTRHKLLFAVAIACEMRLRLHMKQKSQCDLMEMKAHQDGIKNFLNIVGPRSTVHYFQVVYCLQCEVAKLLKLSKLYFYTDPQLINTAICYAFSINAMPGSKISKAPWKIADFNFDDCLNQLDKYLQSQQILVKNDKSESEVKQVNIIANHLYSSKIYGEALEFYRHLYDVYKEQQQNPHIQSNNTSASRSSRQLLSEFIEPFQDSHESLRTHPEIPPKNLEDSSVAGVLYHIGTCLYKLHQHSEALNYSQRALKIYENISLNEATDPKVAGALNNIGNCLCKLHQHTDALVYLQKALKVYQNISMNEEKDSDVAETLNNIGICLRNSRQCTEALSYLQKALTIRQKISLNEESDSDVAMELHNYGSCLHNLHQYTEALDYLKKALKIYQNISLNEETDPDLANALNSIGTCLYKLHQHSEALDYSQRSFKIYQNISLNEKADPDVAMALKDIGTCYFGLHQNTEAINYLQKALQILQKISLNEETDPDVARVLNNMGICCKNLHRHTEALDYSKKALKIHQSITSNEETDPDVAAALTNIGSCYDNSHQYNEAFDYLQKALKIYRNISLNEETDPDVALALINFGNCLCNVHQYTEALEYSQKALKIYQNLSLNEETDPDVANALNSIGICLKDLHQYTEAFDYFPKALKIYQSISLNEETDPQIANVLYNIGICLHDLRQYPEALEYYQEVLYIRQNRSLNKETDPGVADALRNIGNCYNDLHLCNDALGYLKNSLKVYQSISLNEETDPDVADALNDIGICLCGLHQYTEALDCFQKALIIHQNISLNEERDRKVANTLINIGLCLHDLHQYIDELRHLQKALKIRQTISLKEETDVHVANILNNIGNCFHNLHQYTEALDYFQRSLIIYQNTEKNRAIAETVCAIELCQHDQRSVEM